MMLCSSYIALELAINPFLDLVLCLINMKKFDSVTSELSALYWFLVSQQIKFKVLFQVFKAYHKQLPTYTSDFLKQQPSCSHFLILHLKPTVLLLQIHLFLVLAQMIGRLFQITVLRLLNLSENC